MYIALGQAQINLVWTGIGLPFGAQNTFGVQVGQGMDAEDVAHAVSTSIVEAAIVLALSNKVAITGVHVKMGPNDVGPMFDLGVAHQGGDAGQPLPPNTTMLVRKNTAIGGKHGSGRLYIPGITEAASDGTGTLGAESVTYHNGQMADWLEALSSHGIPMVLLHATEWAAGAEQTVTALTVQSVLATQRRRLRG